MGPTWVLSAPDGTHVGPMNLAIRELIPAQLWKHVRNTYLMRSPWASCQIAATHVPWYIPGSLIHDGGRGRGGGGAFSLFCFVFVFCFEYILHTFYICLDASQCDNILFSFTLFSCLKQCFIVFIVLCALLLHGHILGTFYCISINEVTLKSVGKSAVCKSDQNTTKCFLFFGIDAFMHFWYLLNMRVMAIVLLQLYHFISYHFPEWMLDIKHKTLLDLVAMVDAWHLICSMNGTHLYSINQLCLITWLMFFIFPTYNT